MHFYFSTFYLRKPNLLAPSLKSLTMLAFHHAQALSPQLRNEAITHNTSALTQSVSTIEFQFPLVSHALQEVTIAHLAT
jgi:hypothetical protein